MRKEVPWNLKHSPSRSSKPSPGSQRLVAAGIALLKFPVFLSFKSFVAGSCIEEDTHIDLEGIH